MTPSRVGSTTPTQRVAAITMTRDEADMLPRWIRYYGNELGVENLVVLDDNSDDGSTDDLPCTLYRLPQAPWKDTWARTRVALANGFAQGLLACYDAVIFTDVDEFLVPDPDRYDGLVHYISAGTQPAAAPLGVNVLHNTRFEPELDNGQPVLSQRRFVKFAPGMCKPLIKRVPANWSLGFHGIKVPFEIDRELLLIHLKYYDASALATVSAQRHALYEQEGRGGDASAWKLDHDELSSRLRSWVQVPDGHEVPEFDPKEPDLTDVIRRGTGGLYRSGGQQLKAMDTNPLRRLPERFQHVF
jgi:hypothetical protein